MNPVEFTPTKHEISILKALRFIKQHREEFNKDSNEQYRNPLSVELGQALASMTVHLESKLAEESAILANVVKITQMFPQECFDYRITNVNTSYIDMTAKFAPHWIIHVAYNGQKSTADLSLALSDTLDVEIRTRFFLPINLARFILRSEQPKDNKTKDIIIESLREINRDNVYNYRRNARYTDEQKDKIRVLERQLRETKTSPIRTGYCFPR